MNHHQQLDAQWDTPPPKTDSVSPSRAAAGSARPIGRAKRDIEAGEWIEVRVNMDGTLESEAIEFLDTVRETDMMLLRW